MISDAYRADTAKRLLAEKLCLALYVTAPTPKDDAYSPAREVTGPGYTPGGQVLKGGARGDGRRLPVCHLRRR